MKIPDRRTTRPGTTRRVRLKDFHYSTPGFYFVTICTHDRQNLFGTIENELLTLSPGGNMVAEVIGECPARFASVSIDAYVVMPNHIHVLIGLAIRLDDDPGTDDLKDVVHWLKSTVHQRFRAGVQSKGWRPYQGRIWQSGFHDHIVRNEKDLETLRQYVASNVESWEKDRFYDGIER